MNTWEDCYNTKSLRPDGNIDQDRSIFQRDVDKIVFSSAFRRMQNKTQVFPLPRTTFVHNRLTHSLEVSSVGRSLGNIVGKHIATNFLQEDKIESKYFYEHHLSTVISAACLAHDIGNPAFGHSGETAISSYFKENKDQLHGGLKLQSFFSNSEWADLSNFEGNANAFRILTQSFPEKSPYGMGMSVLMLASILKYPCESLACSTELHRKKYAFFQSEKDIFNNICVELDLKKDSESPIAHLRHPFVFLVEAADDICYNIIDMEDAHRLSILTRDQVSSYFLNLIKELTNTKEHNQVIQTYKSIGDANESIAYLRAKVINYLVQKSAAVFIDHQTDILNQNYHQSIVKEIEKVAPTIKEIKSISLEKIYQHDSVIEVEMAGYHVLSGLLDLYVPAILESNEASFKVMIKKLIPIKESKLDSMDVYGRVMTVLDHISAMTDAFAVEHYRKLTGIAI